MTICSNILKFTIIVIRQERTDLPKLQESLTFENNYFSYTLVKLVQFLVGVMEIKMVNSRNKSESYYFSPLIKIKATCFLSIKNTMYFVLRMIDLNFKIMVMLLLSKISVYFCQKSACVCWQYFYPRKHAPITLSPSQSIKDNIYYLILLLKGG